MKQKTIGLDIEHPKGTCTDKNCPFHSTQKLRGRILKGKIIKINPFKSTGFTSFQNMKDMKKEHQDYAFITLHVLMRSWEMKLLSQKPSLFPKPNILLL